MFFKDLAVYLEKLEKTDSRLEITQILADLFREVSADQIDKLCYLVLGYLAPPYKGIEFDLADKMMIRVLSASFGFTQKEVRQMYKTVGDLGTVAQTLKEKGQKQLDNGLFDDLAIGSVDPQADKILNQKSFLSVKDVYDYLMIVACSGGEGSQEQKVALMASLLKLVDPLSVRFLVRIPLGRLRLGFSELTILDALSWLISGDKSHRDKIESAYNVHSDIGYIARIIKEDGLSGLEKVTVSLGVPINLALCQRLSGAEEMIEKMVIEDDKNDLVAVEPKFDGTRLQVHLHHQKGKLKTWLFTRSLEDIAEMFPDISRGIEKEIKAKSVILDGEVIGYNVKTGQLLPFQKTIQRKRKHQIEEAVAKTPLRYYCFDILYFNGRSLLGAPFYKRRKILEKLITQKGKKKKIFLSPQILTDKPEKLKAYHKEQISKGLEGVVVKKWRSPYDVGKRGFTWVKFKQEKGKTGGGLSDTIDGVVMGYYRGRGRRAKFGIGAFLLGIKRTPDDDQFLTVSKIGTGLTDDQWRKMRSLCDQAIAEGKPKNYKVDKNLFPDVWCQPKIVVEIEADNITVSPLHSAGLALRFPRLVRFRADRSPKQVTTKKELEELKEIQENNN
ncbi:MAG: DNA ligase I, ATP-dependent Dnl1 [Microgenomates bacterium 39_6]|nr:MAG: DNA ligase I, ATP-dependent Dnl1 [Microgenomates bacterium 39_6]